MERGEKLTGEWTFQDMGLDDVNRKFLMYHVFF